ncbi:MAG: Ig-like domain-containing protein [Burkholderiales bacterium]|nr:Ig-like domain-containing protein [Burkholderiales bacterium]
MQRALFLDRTVATAIAGPLRGGALALAAALVAALVAACGGGGSGAADSPVADPGPAAITFQLAPARLPLSSGGTGRVLALQAPGALVWSSSDPAVASVDAEGQVTALAAGSAVISASAGAASASARVTVHAPAAPSSATLIENALALNTISAEQALTYRVFALFADPRLPPQFEGAPEGVADDALMRQLSAALPTLSAPTRDLLQPFLVPPIYAQSWFAQRLAGTTPVAAATGARAQAARSARPQATPVNCEAQALPTFWKRLSTAHFNIFYLALGDAAYDNYYRAAAETIAGVVEEVYAAETGLLQRFPLADTTESCNGGDGAVDIYLASLGDGDVRGLTSTYPGRCNHVPSFIAINANDPALQAVGPRLDEARREFKAILAHEIAHVLQFAMDRTGAACADYEWLDEATAEWAMDYVDPGWNREDGANKVSPNYQRSGSFYAQYLYSDHMTSMEKPGLAGSRRKNGYAEYIFFQYLARKYDPQIVKAVFDASTTQGSVEAVEAALAAKGGMKTVWPEFALTLWNDAFNQNLDDFSRWDGYDFGLAPVFERRAGVPPAHPEAEKLKTIDVEQQGAGRQSFKMLKNALERPNGATAGDFYEIQPRSIFYEHLRFTDPTVHSVYFTNPIGTIPMHQNMKVQARKKIAGQWKDVEDWTSEPFKQFCLDKKAERLEELVIVISNSEVNRASEQPFRFPKLFPMLASSSNVGCFMWLGTATTTVTGGSTIVTDSTTSAVSVALVPGAVLPGRITFLTQYGTARGMSVTTAAACTTTLDGASHDFNLPGSTGVFPPTDDGTVDFNLDLDMGFGEVGGEPPDRKLITLTGASRLVTTSTVVCPAVTQVTTGTQSWEWLHVDDPGLYTVSADGQTIEGRFTAPLPGGYTIDSRWKFTSVRE